MVKFSKIKNKILDEIEQQIMRFGLDQFKMQDVAEAIGIKPPSLFSHFKGKDDAIKHIIRRNNYELNQIFQYTAGDDVIEGLDRLLDKIVDYYLKYPARLLLDVLSFDHVGIAMDDIALRSYLPEHLETGELRLLVNRSKQLLNDGIAQGLFNDMSYFQYYNAISGIILMNLLVPIPLNRISPASDEKIQTAKSQITQSVKWFLLK